MHPTTIEEWRIYIDSLSGDELRGVAMAANSLEFIDKLRSEGVEGREVTEILSLFALRFVADEQEPPSMGSGQYLSYPDLIVLLEE
jgi:hypothetical protein